MDARGWDERYGHDGLVWTAEPNRFLVAEVSGLSPGRALDVASGEGRNAVWLAEQGWTVTGVDFSAVGLDKGRRLAEARGVEVIFELADVTTYQPATDFDLVVVLYLHLPAAARTDAVVRAASALRRGGTLLVVGHDITNLTDGIGGPQDPALLYGPADVTADLAGLEIVRAERILRPVDVDGELRNAIDVLVRARRP
jgi:2-polyprenyl-3-methyl-5-hydroxy-6-metoxy-1,4-benzoquinol methylase